MAVKYTGFIFLLLSLTAIVQSLGQPGTNVGGLQSSSFSFPSFGNSSWINDGQFGSGFNGVGSGNSLFGINRSEVSEFINGILNSPVVKIASRAYVLYQNQTEPVDILIDVLPSSDMQQLISILLARIDFPQEQITNVQTIVASDEMVTLIKTFGNMDEYSTADNICVVHNFTKLPEVRKALGFAMNTSSVAFKEMVAQLRTMLTSIPDLNPEINDAITQVLNFDGSRLVNLAISPVVQTFLDVFCELINGGNMPDFGIDIPGASDKSSDNSTDNLPAKSEAQVLPQVANITGVSPEELANQLQAILSIPGIAETIGNLNTSFNILDIIGQLGAALTTTNVTALQDIFTQFQNATQGNGTAAIEQLLAGLVEQANATFQVVMPFVRQYLENIWRSALKGNGVSPGCQDSTLVYMQALLGGETWTLQFIDAMGKIPSNILGLPLKWLGSFDACTAIEGNGGPGMETIKGKYCRTGITIPGIPDLGTSQLTLGTCVPNACSASDALGTLLTVQQLLLNGSTPLVPEITCVEDKEFETDAIIVTCILVIFGSVVLLGTLYDVVGVQMKRKQASETSSSTTSAETLSASTSSSRASTSSSEVPASLYKPIKTRLDPAPGFINNAYTIGVDEMKKDPEAFSDESIDPKKALSKEDVTTNDVMVAIPKEEKPVTQPNAEKGASEKILLSFSAYTNGVKILSTEQASGSLGAINGIRFLSMAWVIMGHTYYFAQGYDDNLPLHYVDKTNQWTFSIIPYATVAVDSFFTISGILVAYLTLRQLKKVGGALKLNWFMYYFHRFWRLTPPYMLILMVGTVILPYVATGPMWDSEDFPGMGSCRKYWWSNLLYINNYVHIYPTTDMCMGWTWYLANDMQFYILSPLILLPFFYHFIAGVASSVVFLAATITATAVLSHKYEYSAQSSNILYAPTPEDEYYFQRVYIPGYCRMGPYIVGLLAGYLLYRFDCKCKIPKVLNLLCWLVCLAICCLDVYGLYSYKDEHIFTQLQSDFFNSLHRTGWGVAVSWIVFACATGHGGWINDVLSWRPFIPLGRLTYGAYLIHPLVMFLFYTSRRNPSFFGDYEVVYLFIGHITLAYGAAFVVGLFFESPMMGLEKVFFNKQKSK